MTAHGGHAKLVVMEYAEVFRAETLRRWALSARDNLGLALLGPARARPLRRGWRGWLMVAATVAGAAFLVPAVLQLLFGSWTVNNEGGGLFIAALLGVVLLALRFPLWAWRASLVLAILTRLLEYESPKAATLQFVLLLAVLALA
jgi:hypothetical protein